MVDGANLRQEPTTASPSLLTFREGDAIEILQKAVEGEAPYRKDGDFTNIWHKVRFREVGGFIFSKALVIAGEDKNSVVKEINRLAKRFNFDPVDDQNLLPETEGYLKDILEFRREYRKKSRFFLLPSLLLLMILSGLLVAKYNSSTDSSRVLGDIVERSKGDEFSNTKKSLVVDLDGDRTAEEIVFIEEGPTPSLAEVSLYLRQDRELSFVDKVGGHFDKAQAIDLNEDGIKELILEVITGHLVITTLYRYDNSKLEYVPEIGSKFHGLSSESSPVIANINHEGSKELILYSFWPPTEECESKAKIYQYHDGQLVKFLDAAVAEEFCNLDLTFWGL